MKAGRNGRDFLKVGHYHGKLSAPRLWEALVHLGRKFKGALWVGRGWVTLL